MACAGLPFMTLGSSGSHEVLMLGAVGVVCMPLVLLSSRAGPSRKPPAGEQQAATTKDAQT